MDVLRVVIEQLLAHPEPPPHAWAARLPLSARISAGNALNHSHAGTHRPLRSQACRFHLGFGLEATRALIEAGLTTPQRMAGASWQQGLM